VSGRIAAIVRSAFGRVAATDLLTLVAVLMALSGSWAFIEIADGVVGSAWAACCWLLAGFLQRRGAIEARADTAITRFGPLRAPSIDHRPTDDAPRA
jgi:hypothetical protein